jgi:hypothetical protein
MTPSTRSHQWEPEELLRLAERCEKAGPDRSIDGAIDRLLNERPNDRDYNPIHDCLWAVDDHSGLCTTSNGFARDSFCARAYTASLDAAMSLLPEGENVEWRITSLRYRRGVGATIWTDGPTVRGDAKSPARALTAACLRSRAAIGEGL